MSDTYLTAAAAGGLGGHLHQLKQEEWARYCGAITEWDREMYWETIP